MTRRPRRRRPRRPRRSDALSGGSGNPARARAGRRPGGSLDRHSAGQRPRPARRSAALAAAIARGAAGAPPRPPRPAGAPFRRASRSPRTLPSPTASRRCSRRCAAVLRALVETPAVTLASVSGACLGGGAEIVAACDLVLVAEDARIGFPEIRLACFPPAAAVLLPLPHRRGAGGRVDPDGADPLGPRGGGRRDSRRAPSRPQPSRAETERARRAPARGVARPRSPRRSASLRGGRREALASRPAGGRGRLPDARRERGSRAGGAGVRSRRGRRPLDSICRADCRLSILYSNGRYLPEAEAAHLAARPRVPLRRRDLRGRALLPRPAVPPRGARRAHARGARGDPDRGLAGLLPRSARAAARGERARRQGRLRLRAGLARRGAPLPRLSAARAPRRPSSPSRGRSTRLRRPRAAGRSS